MQELPKVMDLKIQTSLILALVIVETIQAIMRERLFT